MDSQLMKYLITGAFGMHGAGMIGAAGYSPFDKQGSIFGSSWLLGDGAIATLAGVAVWTVAGVGYVGAAYGYWTDASWWTTWAWVGAIGTLLAIALWFGKIVFGVYIGGLLAVATIWWITRGL